MGFHGRRRDPPCSLHDGRAHIFPSLFPMRTIHWGEWYNQIVGPEQAERISPMALAIRLGVTPTRRTDAPVALPNVRQVKINPFRVLRTINEGTSVWKRASRSAIDRP
jgi:predicted amidohydrolase YtcJ